MEYFINKSLINIFKDLLLKDDYELIRDFFEEIDVNKNLNGRTFLSLAVDKASPKIFEYLISKGANLDSKDKKDLNALHRGCIDLKFCNIEILLNASANPNSISKNLGTPLHIVSSKICLYSKYEDKILAYAIIHLLLKKKSDFKIRHNGKLAFDLIEDPVYRQMICLDVESSKLFISEKFIKIIKFFLNLVPIAEKEDLKNFLLKNTYSQALADKVRYYVRNISSTENIETSIPDLRKIIFGKVNITMDEVRSFEKEIDDSLKESFFFPELPKIRHLLYSEIFHLILLKPLIHESFKLEKLSCESCGNLTNKRCIKCKLSYYCCKECQLKEWPLHQKICKYSS